MRREGRATGHLRGRPASKAAIEQLERQLQSLGLNGPFNLLDTRPRIKISNKPTNASKDSSRCRRAGCRGCHAHPPSKALSKTKGIRNKACSSEFLRSRLRCKPLPCIDPSFSDVYGYDPLSDAHGAYDDDDYDNAGDFLSDADYFYHDANDVYQHEYDVCCDVHDVYCQEYDAHSGEYNGDVHPDGHVHVPSANGVEHELSHYEDHHSVHGLLHHVTNQHSVSGHDTSNDFDLQSSLCIPFVEDYVSDAIQFQVDNQSECIESVEHAGNSIDGYVLVVDHHDLDPISPEGFSIVAQSFPPFDSDGSIRWCQGGGYEEGSDVEDWILC